MTADTAASATRNPSEEVVSMLDPNPREVTAVPRTPDGRRPVPPGMAVPNLRPRYYRHPPLFNVAVIDGHGRLAAISSLRALGWDPGTAVAFTVDEDQVIAAFLHTGQQQRGTAPSRRITPRGYLNLPAVTRRRAGVNNSDRLLLAADADAEVLIIIPPQVLTSALHTHLSPPAEQS